MYDMDNDGWRDIVLAMVERTEDGRVQPVVMRNLGNPQGFVPVPRFDPPPYDRLIGYFAPGPMTDYDRDGRVDVALPSWFRHEQLPSYVFRNTTDGGHWLQVRVDGRAIGLNSMGVGATVRIYEAGHVGEAAHLLGRSDIVVGGGYCSGEEAIAFFGLGKRERCDVEVRWREHRTVKRHVPADQLLMIDSFTGENSDEQ